MDTDNSSLNTSAMDIHVQEESFTHLSNSIVNLGDRNVPDAKKRLGTLQNMLAWKCCYWIEYMIQNFNAHMLTLMCPSKHIANKNAILDRSGHSARQW